jgi:adenosylcobyric acid synthase
MEAGFPWKSHGGGICMAMPIMIQGTMSSAGKSFVCTGLCRIFKQDGFRVAPFKSQNMGSESFITDEGLKMGRAQAMQALAAGIKPSVSMNPILLEPVNDTDSRVVVRGRSKGMMGAADYFGYRRQLRSVVMESYQGLASQYEVIVIEGAGSPAEINLQDDDIVNMGMAEMADAPVLLVGDIDRGGVFAAIYGTMSLLEESQRRRIKGIIINKFRGDVEILRPGLTMLEDMTGLPVLGVVPYLHGGHDDDDGESFLPGGRKQCRQKGESLIPERPGDFPYDVLASALRENLAMDRIYRIVGCGK